VQFKEKGKSLIQGILHFGDLYFGNEFDTIAVFSTRLKVGQQKKTVNAQIPDFLCD
jgi:hypothetical protein